MSLSVNSSNISRDQIFQEYQNSPESAPLKIPGLVNTMAAEAYRFEKLMARFSSPTAGGLVDEATRDAEVVKKGSVFSLIRGSITLCAGMASFAGMTANPLLLVVGIVAIYFGMNWIRDGNMRIRQSEYDKRFAADVARYAGQVAAAAGGENAVWQQE